MKGFTVVFDLDGTLVDTAPDLAEATNHVLGTLGLERVSELEIRPFVGHGALAMIEAAVTSHGRKLTERELHDLFQIFFDYYSANIAVRSTPYANMVTALEALRSEGATLAVCTNKIEIQARQVLKALKLDGYFSALAGGRPDASIMIGDSETDIKTAKAAHVPIVAVSFGYSVDPVASFGPDAI